MKETRKGSMKATMKGSIKELLDSTRFGPMSRQLAKRLSAMAPNPSQELELAIALCHRALSEGDLCYRIGREESIEWMQEGETKQSQLPEPNAWILALQSSGLLDENGTSGPLKLDEGNRLYLLRYYDYQMRLAQELTERMEPLEPLVSPEWIQAKLAKLFAPSEQPDLQLLAALNGLHQRLSVLSGGPGTGKTTTVTKILALLQEARLEAGLPAMEVLLLAPTGKAASRMMESIRGSLAHLNLGETLERTLPKEAKTIHRALQVDPFKPHAFRHDQSNPLAADLILIDEASMIDLPLFTKLMEATPKQAQVILLGDRDQLASVEAGAILGDICNKHEYQGYSLTQYQAYQKITGYRPPDETTEGAAIADCITHLTKSHRFGMDQTVGRLASAIREGDARKVMQVIEDSGMTLLNPEEEGFLEGIYRQLRHGYDPLLRAKGPEEALQALGEFTLLCAHRVGDLGVESMNAFLERRLEREGLIEMSSSWYHKRPIMITANDPSLELYNGDMGVLWQDESEERIQVKAYFPGLEKPRVFSTALLPAHETAFAMTVHKSQGSEFQRVALLLGDRPSPLLTRELLYTAVTRAKDEVLLFAREEEVTRATANPIRRDSGLKDLLWRPLL